MRFTAHHTSALRRWQGGGALRVIPISLPFQVLHSWHEYGGSAGWNVNLEAPKRRTGDRLAPLTGTWTCGWALTPNPHLEGCR
jgi:hypothetical protein